MKARIVIAKQIKELFVEANPSILSIKLIEFINRRTQKIEKNKFNILFKFTPMRFSIFIKRLS